MIDALLGAARLGDVGGLFPPDDERLRDADSGELLKAAVARLREAGWRPVGVDLAIVARRPAIAPRRDELVKRLAELTGLEPAAVSVKGTTSDGLGFAGAEGIAAFAVATVRPRLTEWIGGRRPVAEALAAGREAHRLLVSKQRSAESGAEGKSWRAAREASVPVETVPGDRLAAAGRIRRAPGRAARGGGATLGGPGGDAGARRGGRPRPADPAAREPAGSDELRHAAALGGGGRRRRRDLSGAGSGAALRGSGQGQRRRQRAPAAGPGRQPGPGAARPPGARAARGGGGPGCARRPRGRRT